MRLLIFFLIFFLCMSAAGFAETAMEQQNAFRPPDGQTWVFIGQDKASIDAYVKNFGVVPAGVMLYTSIQELGGLESPSDYGSGVHHAAYLLKRYPDSALQIGLYMVGALEGINRGEYDEQIARLARWVQSTGRPVFLRIGYEFDFTENQYEPSAYKDAFRRIVDTFRSLKVENVVFVWHSSIPPNSRFEIMAWYPGDEYVDWFASSFFTVNQFKPTEDFAALAKQHGKPLMFAETTPFATMTVRSKLDWLKKFFRLIESTDAQAICYINTDWEAQSMFKGQQWGDSRMEQSPELKSAWLAEMQKSRFLQASDFFAK